MLPPTPEPSVWFVERTSISLNDVLKELNFHRRVILTGLPGVGKTELAAQVVDKAKLAKVYKGIFWLSAATEKTLDSAIIEMARELDLTYCPVLGPSRDVLVPYKSRSPCSPWPVRAAGTAICVVLGTPAHCIWGSVDVVIRMGRQNFREL